MSFLENKMTLSNQAIGSIMMALQKAILNQEDITGILRGFDFNSDDNNELIVNNPPTVSAPEDDVDE
jgi:hypothetical protein